MPAPVFSLSSFTIDDVMLNLFYLPSNFSLSLTRFICLNISFKISYPTLRLNRLRDIRFHIFAFLRGQGCCFLVGVGLCMLLEPLLALDYSIANSRRKKLDCPDGIIITRDNIVDVVRIAVCINYSYYRNFQFLRLFDGNALALRINDKQAS